MIHWFRKKPEKPIKQLFFALGSKTLDTYSDAPAILVDLKTLSEGRCKKKYSFRSRLLVKAQWDGYLLPVIDCDSQNCYLRAKSYLQSERLSFVSIVSSLPAKDNDFRAWIIIDQPRKRWSDIADLVEECPGQDEAYGMASHATDVCYLRFGYSEKFSKPFLKEKYGQISYIVEEFVDAYFKRWDVEEGFLQDWFLKSCLFSERVPSAPHKEVLLTDDQTTKSLEKIELGDKVSIDYEEPYYLVYQILRILNETYYCCLDISEEDPEDDLFCLVKETEVTKVTKPELDEMLTHEYSLLRYLGKVRYESSSNLQSEQS